MLLLPYMPSPMASPWGCPLLVAHAVSGTLVTTSGTTSQLPLQINIQAEAPTMNISVACLLFTSVASKSSHLPGPPVPTGWTLEKLCPWSGTGTEDEGGQSPEDVPKEQMPVWEGGRGWIR